MKSTHPNIVVIIQARMGSTRLPGKMMMDLGGVPVIVHVVNRTRIIQSANEVWLATTTNQDDDVLAEWAETHDLSYVRGSADDVLDRYHNAAEQAHADVIVRITGDCPLIDPEIADRVIQRFLDTKCDYASNTHPPTFPDGLDVEVTSRNALEHAWREATLHSEREHVMPYLWEHPELFHLENLKNDIDLSAHRWTLDTPEDLEFLRHVVEACNEQNEFCDMKKILEIVNAHPEWQKINKKFERNEGYAKSVAEDAIP